MSDDMNDTKDEWQDRPTKGERKRHSEELQVLGEALIELPQSELDALPLPEQLREAVMLARRITKHGGLYRQRQYIGKLMRKIDAEPIRAALQARREHERAEALRFRRVEQLRDQLLSEGAPALERIATILPDADIHALKALVEHARHEHAANGPKHASRELFRTLRDLLGTMTP